MPPHHVSRFSDTTLHKIADIFNLQLLDLYHENVDRGITRKIINKIGKVGKHFIKIPPNAYGHTVVAVYTPK